MKKNYFNFFVITCTKVLFTSEGFKYNFGNNYNIVIFADIVLLGIFFVIKGYHSFQQKINNIIDPKFDNYNEEVSQNEADLTRKVEIDDQDQKKK